MPQTDLHINSNIIELTKGLDDAVKATDRLGDKTKEYQQKSNQAFTASETNIKEVNQAIKDQSKILKDLNRESEKYAKRAKTLSADEQKAWKRLQGDIKVAGQEMDALKGKQAKLAASSENVTSKLSAQFSKLAKLIAGVFTVTAIIRFSRESVNAYQEQIRSEAKLRVALKGQDAAISRIIKHANELQKVTFFNDEEIINAQGLLALFVKEEDQLKKLTPLVLDFAQAKGMDLAAAANIIGKTFGSSINALSRYGIVVNGIAGSSQRFNDIMEGLTRTVQGQAEGALTEEEEALRKGTVAVQELKESWGELVLSFSQTGIFKSLTDTIDYLAWGLDKARESGGRFKDWWQWFWQTGDFGSEVFEMERNAEKNADKLVENAKALTQKTGGKTYADLVNDWIDAAAIPKEIETLDSLKAKLDEIKKEQSASPLDLFTSFQPQIDALEAQIALYEKKSKKDKEITKSTVEENLASLDRYVEEANKKIFDIELGFGGTQSAEEFQKQIDENLKGFEEAMNVTPEFSPEDSFEAKAWDAAFELAQDNLADFEKLQQDTWKRMQDFADAHPLAAAMGFNDEEQLEMVRDYVGKLVDFANEIIDQQVEADERIVDNLNQRINEQSDLVEQEFDLKQEGLANNYELEKENLQKMQEQRDQAIKDQEKSIKIQRTLGTIESGVSLVVAAANIMKGFSEIPIVGVILGIAAVGAMITAFILAQNNISDATQLAKGGRLNGPRHSEGGMRIEGTDYEVEGKEWFVNAKSSEKYNDLLTAINKDDQNALQIAVNKHNLIKAFPVNTGMNIDDSTKLSEIIKLLRNEDGIFMGKDFYIEKRGTLRKTIRMN